MAIVDTDSELLQGLNQAFERLLQECRDKPLYYEDTLKSPAWVQELMQEIVETFKAPDR